jgi:hypothetical protein
MIVKVIGENAVGGCVERAADTINLYETLANLRKMGREMAWTYLAMWPNVAAVRIRNDRDHTTIVIVKRTDKPAQQT